jgi:ABC-2 type transport system ATP-binding protein
MTIAESASQFALTEVEGPPAISVSQLTKVYPKGLKAVDSVSFEVQRGEVFGLLGPNGAGKTTIIKVIMTLTKATAGQVMVNGVDALRRPALARQMMGYVPQDVSVDGDLTAYENLLISAKLYFVERGVRQQRIAEALKLMGLEERKDDMVKTFSGGMMRRLEIAQALVNRPQVLFLDEPSIGLDPNARHEVWRYVKHLNKEFDTTIFVTTHDMAEADELCDRIAIMNGGRFVITGSPSELKADVGGDLVTVKVSKEASKGTPSSDLVSVPDDIGTILTSAAGESSDAAISIVVRKKAEEAIPDIMKAFEAAGVDVASISVSRPTLDDVFLKFTQTRIDEAEYRQARSARRSFRKHSK